MQFGNKAGGHFNAGRLFLRAASYPVAGRFEQLPQVSFTIGNPDAYNELKELIVKLSPDYLRISAPGAEPEKDAGRDWGLALKSLRKLQDLHGGQTHAAGGT